MPVCATVSQWLQNLTQVSLCSNEQHKESSQARQQRDHKDTLSIMTYLSPRNPFAAGEELRCIASGQLADASVNVDNAEAIGKSILSGMDGLSVLDVSFKKKNQAVTMATNSVIKIGPDSVQVDPQLLF